MTTTNYRICQNVDCNKRFYVNQSNQNWKRQIYCSDKCQRYVYNKKMRVYNKLRDEFRKDYKNIKAQEFSEKTKREHKNGTYIVRAEGMNLYKIGYSTHMYKRMIGIRMHSPIPVTLIHVIEQNVEMELHDKLVKYKSHGEWYKLTEIQVQGIINSYPERIE